MTYVITTDSEWHMLTNTYNEHNNSTSYFSLVLLVWFNHMSYKSNLSLEDEEGEPALTPTHTLPNRPNNSASASESLI